MFIEVSLGGIQYRNKIISENDLLKITPAKGEEFYRSMYEYDEEILQHLKIYKTVKGFKGVRKITNIVLDIDAGKDSPLHTLEKTRAFYEFLKDDYRITPKIFFSGRGYHLEIPAKLFNFQPSKTLPILVKEVMKSLFPIADNIFDGARLIRVANSINLKSNLYKVQLSEENLFKWSVEHIHQYAATPQKLFEIEDVIIPDLSHYVAKIQQKPDVKSLQESKNNIITCISKMWEEGAMEGTRHNKMLRIVSAFRRGGVPKEAIYYALKEWANTLHPYEVKSQVENIYDKGYSYSCNDALMTKYCDPACLFYKNKNYGVEIKNSDDIEEKLRKRLRDTKSLRFNLGDIFYIPDPEGHWIYGGEFILLIGDTKLGKSMLMQNLCVKLSNFPILYLSLEMSDILTYRRFLQIAYNQSSAEIKETLEKENTSLAEPIKHIKIMTASPNLLDLEKAIASSGCKIIVVDVIDGLIVAGAKDSNNAKLEEIASFFKRVAERLDVVIIGIHHIPKSAVADNKRLNVHSGKGASSLEQKADKIWAIEGDVSGSQRMFSALASRDTGLFRLSLNMDNKTFRFSQPQTFTQIIEGI